MTAGVQEQHCILKVMLSQQQMCINWLHLVRSCLLTLKQLNLMPKVNTVTICSRFRTEAELDFPVWLTAVKRVGCPLPASLWLFTCMISAKVFLLGLAFLFFLHCHEPQHPKCSRLLAVAAWLTVHATPAAANSWLSTWHYELKEQWRRVLSALKIGKCVRDPKEPISNAQGKALTGESWKGAWVGWDRWAREATVGHLQA